MYLERLYENSVTVYGIPSISSFFFIREDRFLPAQEGVRLLRQEGLRGTARGFGMGGQEGKDVGGTRCGLGE